MIRRDAPRGPQLGEDAELQSAICIYLIAERREGATIGELAQLKLGGRPPSKEVSRVSAAVSTLVREGEVRMEGELVVPH